MAATKSVLLQIPKEMLLPGTSLATQALEDLGIWSLGASQGPAGSIWAGKQSQEEIILGYIMAVQIYSWCFCHKAALSGHLHRGQHTWHGSRQGCLAVGRVEVASAGAQLTASLPCLLKADVSLAAAHTGRWDHRGRQARC